MSIWPKRASGGAIPQRRPDDSVPVLFRRSAECAHNDVEAKLGDTGFTCTDCGYRFDLMVFIPNEEQA